MLSVLQLFLCFSSLVQAGWTWSAFPEAGFKVLSPVTLSHKMTEVPTQAGTIQYHQYHGGSIQDPVTPMTFIVDHYVLPPSEYSPDDEFFRDLFENTLDELLTAVNGTLMYMDISSAAGREVCRWKAAYQEGEGVIRGEIILAGDRYYGLQVFGWRKDKPEALMQKFLDSFTQVPVSGP